MSYYREHKEIILGTIGALLVIFLGLFLPFVFSPGLVFSEKLELMQVTFSAVAFFAVFIVLIITISQFRKSMAKPELRLAFTEHGEAETTIRVSKIKYLYIDLDFWVINEGNSIAKLFQIELEIPGIYNPHYRSKEEGRTLECLPGKSSERGTVIASLCNNEKIISFVNSPVKIEDVKLGTDHRGYSDFKDFPINYRIIGDWGKPREGTLKVHVEKD